MQIHERRWDQRFGIGHALLYNIHRPEGEPPMRPMQFFEPPPEQPKHEREMTTEEMELRMRGVTALMKQRGFRPAIEK